MKFICQIGNCKRNKKASEFETLEELFAHISGPKWLHKVVLEKNHAARNRVDRNRASGMAVRLRSNQE